MHASVRVSVRAGKVSMVHRGQLLLGQFRSGKLLLRQEAKGTGGLAKWTRDQGLGTWNKIAGISDRASGDGETFCRADTKPLN